MMFSLRERFLILSIILFLVSLCFGLLCFLDDSVEVFCLFAGQLVLLGVGFLLVLVVNDLLAFAGWATQFGDQGVVVVVWMPLQDSLAALDWVS